MLRAKMGKMNLILCVDENIYLLLPQIFAYPGQKHWSQIIPINLNVNNVMRNKGVTHPFESFHLLRDDILQDKGEGHLVVIVQQRVNGFLQPHKLILFLKTQQTNNHYKLSPAASAYPLSGTHNKQTTITSFLQPHQLILFLKHTTNKQPLQAFSSRISLSSFWNTQQTNNHYKLSPAASAYPLSETHNKQTTITSFRQPHQLILFLKHTTNKQPLQAFSSRASAYPLSGTHNKQTTITSFLQPHQLILFLKHTTNKQPLQAFSSRISLSSF